LSIPTSAVKKALACAVMMLTLLSFMAVHYVFTVDEAAQNGALKQENVLLKARLRAVQDEVARIDTTLQRIDRFATRVRAITQLSDPERNLAMGPLSLEPPGKHAEVLYAKGERIEYEDESIDSKLALRMIDSNLDQLGGEARRQQDNVRQLRDHFADKDLALSTTPSIRPTRSRLLTSAFGSRTDPYTERQVMHKGIDFAADHGSEVVAPGDAHVIFVGSRGNGYGKTVVLDHGLGLQTHFAHLSDFFVQVGQQVTRGQPIAAVGNTGRTTGAHLHYEVRFYGVPQDPEKFILD
ncbi:MAG: M23 family metallopeptidase, partial [Deltaproteobacteria bacterium]